MFSTNEVYLAKLQTLYQLTIAAYVSSHQKDALSIIGVILFL